GLGSAFSEPAASAFERLDAMLTAYLETLAADPAAARTFLIEVYAAGELALARRVEVMGRFVDLVQTFSETDDRLRCEALVGAVSWMVTMRVAAGDHASLPQLRAPLLAMGAELLGLER